MPILARRERAPRRRSFKLRVWWALLSPLGDSATLAPRRGCALQEWRDGDVVYAGKESKPLVANLGDRLFLAHPDIDVAETCSADVTWTDGERYRLARVVGEWPTVEWVRVMPMKRAKAA